VQTLGNRVGEHRETRLWFDTAVFFGTMLTKWPERAKHGMETCKGGKTGLVSDEQAIITVA